MVDDTNDNTGGPENPDTVVRFPLNNLLDIPKQMRALADRIESGEFAPQRAVFLMEVDSEQMPEVFAWGAEAGDIATVHFMLAKVQSWFCRMEVRR